LQSRALEPKVGRFVDLGSSTIEVSVRIILADSAWSLQPEASNTAAPAAPSTPGASAEPPGLGTSMQPMLMLAVMFGIFYFLLIRPQQKRQREMDDLLKSLKKGDKVRTTGGIRGEIVELTESEAWLLIADKVKINVLRANIATRIDRPAAEAKAEEKPAS
jgi:preprotein translocase subunit YajC